MIKFVLLIISVAAVNGKIFTKCELAKELFFRHHLRTDEVGYHLCIANLASYNTQSNSDGFLGLYRIGSKWWCGNGQRGGNCKIKCSELVDDDISDDVYCANEIIRNAGVEAWGLNRSGCESSHSDARDCLREVAQSGTRSIINNYFYGKKEVRES